MLKRVLRDIKKINRKCRNVVKKAKEKKEKEIFGSNLTIENSTNFFSSFFVFSSFFKKKNSQKNQEENPPPSSVKKMTKSQNTKISYIIYKYITKENAIFIVYDFKYTYNTYLYFSQELKKQK